MIIYIFIISDCCHVAGNQSSFGLWVLQTVRRRYKHVFVKPPDDEDSCADPVDPGFTTGDGSKPIYPVVINTINIGSPIYCIYIYIYIVYLFI